MGGVVVQVGRGKMEDFHWGLKEMLLLACDLHRRNVEWGYGPGRSCRHNNKQLRGSRGASVEVWTNGWDWRSETDLTQRSQRKIAEFTEKRREEKRREEKRLA